MKAINAVFRHHISTIVLSVVLMMAMSAVVFLNGCKEETTTLGPEDLTNPAVQPRVLFTLPQNNATGPFELFDNMNSYGKPHFVVRFNKLMDLSSFQDSLFAVEGFNFPVRVRAFRIYYLYEGTTRPRREPQNDQFDDVVSFTIMDSVTFAPAPYTIGATYTVHLKPGVRDINGNRTAVGYRFTYMPEPEFRVIDFSPHDNGNGVNVTSQILINFNSKIDQSTLGSLTISPPLEGQWVVTGFDSSAALFKPLEFLTFGTLYTVTVLPDARDSHGNVIHNRVRYSFRVAPFEIVGTSPRNGGTLTYLNSSILLAFSGLIDTSTVRQGISVTPLVAVEFSHYTSGTVLYPTVGFAPGTEYSVHITTSVRAYDGTPLSEPYTLTFSTSTFRVEYTYPSDGDFNVYRSLSLSVGCNGQIDTGSVPPSFDISPHVSGHFYLFEGSSSYNFIPAEALAANTLYTVTISTALRTKSGFHLPQPYTFRFKTGL